MLACSVLHSLQQVCSVQCAQVPCVSCIYWRCHPPSLIILYRLRLLLYVSIVCHQDLEPTDGSLEAVCVWSRSTTRAEYPSLSCTAGMLPRCYVLCAGKPVRQCAQCAIALPDDCPGGRKCDVCLGCYTCGSVSHLVGRCTGFAGCGCCLTELEVLALCICTRCLMPLPWTSLRTYVASWGHSR